MNILVAEVLTIAAIALVACFFMTLAAYYIVNHYFDRKEEHHKRIVGMYAKALSDAFEVYAKKLSQTKKE